VSRLMRWQYVRAQFEGLEGKHPGLWPPLPRMLCPVVVAVLVVATGAWLVWMPQWDEMEGGELAERQLRQSFERKLAQTQHLDHLRKQKTEVAAQVSRQQRQLPSKAEMDALLSEISQAAVLRGLQIELFKPGQLRISQHYAELPIEIRLSGSFHALAGFVSDIANMPRIVTIDRISISQQREGVLSFECVAHAFRYLEQAESESKKAPVVIPKNQGSR
jgi:type IV pilus assembly protein PilO